MESATTRDVAVPSRTGGRHYADALLHVAALSLVAGGIHAVAAPPHFAESLSRGVFFAALAAFQLAWGTLIYSRPSGRGFQLGAVVSVGVIALWAISRTAGVPFGPDAWQAEAVGPLDLAATVSEALIIALAAGFLFTGVRASAGAERPGLPDSFRVVRPLVTAALIAGVVAMVLGGHHVH